MDREPIRIPAIVASLILLIVVPAATALIEGDSWRPVLLAALAAVPILLGGAETARAFTDSPATRANEPAWVAVAGVPATRRANGPDA